MTKHQIGDNVHLRALADKLRPDDMKVLPDEVDISNWIPVIPYDNALNVVDEFHAIMEADYITLSTYNASIGSDSFSGSLTDLVLPRGGSKGFIYQLIDFEVLIDMGAAVTSGDHLTIDLLEEMDRWPITFPGGSTQFVREHYKQRQLFYQQNPFRLSSGSQVFSYQWPSGTYKNYDTDFASYTHRPHRIFCPNNSLFGSRLRVRIGYFDTSHANKNFDAAAEIKMNFRFSRKPLDLYTVNGAQDFVPP